LLFSTVGKLGSIEIQTVGSEGIEDFLRWVHCEAAEPELAGIASEYRFRQGICWLPQPVEVLLDDQRIAAAYFTCLPGDLAMLGGVRAVPGAEKIAEDVLRNQIQTIRGRLPIAHIQAAVSDADRPIQQLVQASGFEPLTAVDQLWSSLVDDQITHPVEVSSPMSAELQWLPASHLSRQRFVKLIEATFDGTLDCPELNKVRSNEQVVQSFLMNRPFRGCPYWFTLWHRQRVAGCLLLLSHNAELVEVVYMGLIPEARRRGLGRLIIEQAKRVAINLGATMLVLAVDVRNTPAIKTYQHNGFRFHRRLQVYWYR
jgi:ribosomal protein S18 acetylase RimI-like enzyme